MQCPRCGYDLRGVADAWRECCPLDGQCSECGLEFAWVEIMRPEFGEPPWCIEYAKRWHWFITGGWRTAIRVWCPTRFWSWLQMRHRMVPERLIVYPLVLIVLLLASGLLERVALGVRLYVDYERGAFVGRWGPRYPQSWDQTGAPVFIIMRDAIVPRADGWGMFDPYELLDWSRSDDIDAIATSKWNGFGLAMWMNAALPMLFVLLPVSRRRAKVRAGHLVRVLMYTLAAACTGLVVSELLIALHHLCFERLEILILSAASLMGFLLPAGMVLWSWRCAIRHYLRMPHSEMIVLLLTAIGLMVPAIIYCVYVILATAPHIKITG